MVADRAHNTLVHSPLNQPRQLIECGSRAASPSAQRVTRVPAGHPEGDLEGFAKLYTEAARAIRAVDAGLPVPVEVQFPSLDDGVCGMAFIEAAVRSSAEGGVWVRPAYV